MSATRRAKLGILTIGRKRPGFDQQWNQVMRDAAAKAVAAAGLPVASPEQVVVDEQTTRAALAKCQQAGADVLLVLQPSLGNGQLALTVGQLWSGGTILWATPERPEGEKVSSCSLVAQHLWASVLRQLNRPFEFVYGDPNDAKVQAALADAAAVCSAHAALKKSRIAVVGSHAPGFIAMDADPFAVQHQFGAQMHRLSLAQFMDRVRGVDESAVKSDVDVVRELKLPMTRVTDDDLALGSRFYLALKGLMDEEALDAVALQEWPELPQVLGQWPYLAMSRLTDEGRIITMEGDLDGAILSLTGQQLGAGFGYLTDWLDHASDTIHFWHAGMAPLSWIDRPRLGRHFNVDVPLVVDGPIKPIGPMTIARWWRVDGRYRGVVFEGLTQPPPRELTGNTSLIRIERDAHSLFEQLIHAGMPHHVALFRGTHLNRITRLMRMLGIEAVA